MAEVFVGVDLGGTNIKAVLMDRSHAAGRVAQVPTPPEPGQVVEQMADVARKLLAEGGLSAGDVLGVGIGAPGPAKLSEGIIIALSNIPTMKNFPLRDLVGDALSLPAVLENDANAAAYGEFLCGSGRGTRNMVLLTLGTGIGSGIIVDGRVLHGSHEIGAELGHVIVETGGEACGCGQAGCLERYCSATYIALRAHRLIEQEGRGGMLAETLAAGGQITSKDILAAHLAGDELGCELWDRAAKYLAIACVDICRVFDPDKIVLAGGMAMAGDHLIAPLLAHFRREHWSLTEPMTEIAIAGLAGDAGAIGAAGVAWSTFGDQ